MQAWDAEPVVLGIGGMLALYLTSAFQRPAGDFGIKTNEDSCDDVPGFHDRD